MHFNQNMGSLCVFLFRWCCSAHLSFVKPLESVVDGKHFVPLRDPHSDGGAHGGVHAGGGGSYIQHRHVEVALGVSKQNIIEVGGNCVTSAAFHKNGFLMALV